ncbi:MAG: ABC transporter permease [Phycisphaerales bacterium]|nr:ABC transporter permease [Phycisphaerales bacterium]
MSDGAPQIVSGIEAMRGVGAVRVQGFWTDAWSRVLKRKQAIFGIAWISTVAFFAVFAPLIANAHPLLVQVLGADGAVVETRWPLFSNLSPTDLLLLLGTVLGAIWLLAKLPLPRSLRLGVLIAATAQAGLSVIICAGLADWLSDSDRGDWVKQLNNSWDPLPWVCAASVSLLMGLLVTIAPTFDKWRWRAVVLLIVALATTLAIAPRWSPRLTNFETYINMERAGKVRAVYTLVPWSPEFVRSDLVAVPPGTRVGDRALDLAGTSVGERRMILGSDAIGGDVLSQMMWACRLSISIGLVSTGIALSIGVTMGSLMGYFGGKVDLLLYRVVEIFMAIPVLFLLIVAAGVLPRNTYVMMAIIGCVSWTGAARFTRAEFLKLRGQDFVQAARAVGLPLRSVLFRHMLPNGVTPVLVDASFAVAAAILAEATLSYLGLGPDGQASWGKLLASATAATGTFVWWLAIFPGAAIFLSVLSYNLLGEALRDAIDPKLRKAAH